MKRLLVCTLLLMLSVAAVHAEPNNARHENVKFGVHIRGITFSKVGAFIEYPIHAAFGLQAGLLYFRDSYTMSNLEEVPDTSIEVEPRYVSMPLILRVYPGEDRQFCTFAGLQLNYVLEPVKLHAPSKNIMKGIDILNRTMNAADGLIKSVNSPQEFTRRFEELGRRVYSVDLKDEIQQEVSLSHWVYHYVLGFDYEFLLGFQLGLEIGRGLSTLAKCEDTSGNWTCKLALGYNLAKLIAK